MQLLSEQYKVVQQNYKLWVKSRIAFSESLYAVAVRAFAFQPYNLGSRQLYSLEGKLYYLDSTVPLSKDDLIDVYESNSVFRNYINSFLAE